MYFFTLNKLTECISSRLIFLNLFDNSINATELLDVNERVWIETSRSGFFESGKRFRVQTFMKKKEAVSVREEKKEQSLLFSSRFFVSPLLLPLLPR
jgi:hypothetical protein